LFYWNSENPPAARARYWCHPSWIHGGFVATGSVGFAKAIAGITGGTGLTSGIYPVGKPFCPPAPL